ncbi:MAG: hypothetical protein GX131_16390 [candidate division WS1 bacterium]|jgi:hypothetical protein|nr:hypothetical protein [candidate division WS1 bacterium]
MLTAVVVAVAVLLSVPVSVTAQGISYSNDFEEANDLRLWVAGGEIEVEALELCDEAPAQGERCAKVQFSALSNSHYVYFAAPVDQRWEPGMRFLVDGMVKVDAPEYVSVSLGINRRLLFDGNDQEGNGPVTPTVEARGEWVRLLSGDVSDDFRQQAAVRGMSPLVEWTVKSVYLHILGAREGDRVTVWLDDLQVREPTDEDARQWALQQAELALEHDTPEYPWLDETFAWGVTGSLEGQNRVLELPDEMVAAIIARDYKENFFDTTARLGGMVMQRHGAEAIEQVGRLLDLTAQHDMRVQISTYITGYYEPNVPREELAALAERVVNRYRDHPALLAWYIVDEPRPELDILRDHWLWGKQIIEALDPQHPVMSAFNNAKSVAMYAPYAAVMQIDWYPIGRGEFAGDYPAVTNAAMCEIAWANGAERVWFIPQAYADVRKRRLPTAAELRLMTWQPLACGATGILFYSHQSRPVWHPWGGSWAINDILLRRTGEIGAEVERLSREVPILGPVLLGTKWVADAEIEVQCEEIPIYALPAVRADLSRGSDYDVIVVTNQDVKAAQTAMITLPDTMVAGRVLCDLNEDNIIDHAPAEFHVTLEPGEGRMFTLSGPQENNAIRAGIFLRRYEKLRRLFEVELAEARACGVDVAAAEASMAMAAQVHADADATDPVLPQAAAMQVGRAREALQEALTADERYSAAAKRLEAYRERVGLASDRLTEIAAQIGDESERRALMGGEMKPQTDALMECVRDWYRLRYALMTGEVDRCLQGLPAAEARAEGLVVGD